MTEDLKPLQQEEDLSHLLKINQTGIQEFPYDIERPDYIDAMSQYLKKRMAKSTLKKGHFTVIATIYPDSEAENDSFRNGGRLFF